VAPRIFIWRLIYFVLIRSSQGYLTKDSTFNPPRYNNWNFTIFEVLTAVLLTIQVLRDIMLFRWVRICQRSKRPSSLYCVTPNIRHHNQRRNCLPNSTPSYSKRPEFLCQSLSFPFTRRTVRIDQHYLIPQPSTWLLLFSLYTGIIGRFTTTSYFLVYCGFNANDKYRHFRFLKDLTVGSRLSFDTG
jgi:hypothetical protein